MKILIMGSSGLLGSKLVVAAKNHEIIPTHNTKPLFSNSVKMDITDKNEVLRILGKFKPDVAIHAAALTNVDYCEKNRKEAWMINVEGTKNIADACRKIGSKMVYISTAGIFDGKHPPYSETDSPNPLNYYAQTKLHGEHHALTLKNCIVARTAVLYGWHPWKLNFVTWIIDNLRKNKQIKVVIDQRNTPTYADDFANALVHLIELDQKGIFNVAGSTSINRFDFATKIAKTFNLDDGLISPTTTKELNQVALRPNNDSLRIDKILKLGIKMLTVDEGLQKMKMEKRQ